MIPKEILEKILRIDITTNRLVTDVFAGLIIVSLKAGDGI